MNTQRQTTCSMWKILDTMPLKFYGSRECWNERSKLNGSSLSHLCSIFCSAEFSQLLSCFSNYLILTFALPCPLKTVHLIFFLVMLYILGYIKNYKVQACLIKLVLFISSLWLRKMCGPGNELTVASFVHLFSCLQFAFRFLWAPCNPRVSPFKWTADFLNAT